MGCAPSKTVTGGESDAELYKLLYGGSADAAHCLLRRHEHLDLSGGSELQQTIDKPGRPPKRLPVLAAAAAEALGEALARDGPCRCQHGVFCRRRRGGGSTRRARRLRQW